MLLIVLHFPFEPKTCRLNVIYLFLFINLSLTSVEKITERKMERKKFIVNFVGENVSFVVFCVPLVQEMGTFVIWRSQGVGGAMFVPRYCMAVLVGWSALVKIKLYLWITLEFCTDQRVKPIIPCYSYILD